MTTPLPTSVPDDLPIPILMNVFKHHVSSLRLLVSHAVQQGDEYLPQLAETLLVLGENLMDLYIGSLSPQRIADVIIAHVSQKQKLSPEPFAAWMEETKGYRVVTFSHLDQSNWVLRLAEEHERYIHVHPGRWSPASLRVRAHSLKTAVMAVTSAKLSGGDPFDVKQVNELRTTYLGLSPIKEVHPEQGLGKIVKALV